MSEHSVVEQAIHEHNEGSCDHSVNNRDTILTIHSKLTEKLFPLFSSQDERFLALALCGEVGELANMIKKRWRDDVDLVEEIRDELADIRVYLELLAHQFDIDGERLDQRVAEKLRKVAAKHGVQL
jgi:NTP pyrophosphatase (non-canonical NTP hydrolase)